MIDFAHLLSGSDVEVDHLTGVYKNLTRGIVALVFRCYAANGTPQATAGVAEAPG